MFTVNETIYPECLNIYWNYNLYDYFEPLKPTIYYFNSEFAIVVELLSNILLYILKKKMVYIKLLYKYTI